MSRPTWDEYFMEITHLVARRSTCLRRQVGAVLVKDKNILQPAITARHQALPTVSMSAV